MDSIPHPARRRAGLWLIAACAAVANPGSVHSAQPIVPHSSTELQFIARLHEVYDRLCALEPELRIDPLSIALIRADPA